MISESISEWVGSIQIKTLLWVIIVTFFAVVVIRGDAVANRAEH